VDGKVASNAEMAALSQVVARATAAHGMPNGGSHATGARHYLQFVILHHFDKSRYSCKEEDISPTCDMCMTAAQLAQAAAAAAVDPEDADEAVAAAQLEDSDAERMLDGLLWEFTITKEAREEWAALAPVYKCAVSCCLDLSSGCDVFHNLHQSAKLAHAHWQSAYQIMRVTVSDYCMRQGFKQ
jgi:hypothetical protein